MELFFFPLFFSFFFLSFFLLFFTRGGCVSCLRAGLGARLLPQPQYPNLSEGADRVGGQLRGDKECSFSGVTKSGRVWRKMPESDARSVETDVTDEAQHTTKLVGLPIVAITRVKSTREGYEKIGTRVPETAEEEAGKHRRSSRKMTKKPETTGKEPESTEEEARNHR